MNSNRAASPPVVPVVELRRAQTAFVRAAGTRRSLPRTFHLGTPGGEHVILDDAPGLDAGLRADVVERALDGFGSDQDPAPVPWVTRSGELVAGDADVAWLSAAIEAYGRHGVTLPGFFVVTRHGWVDLVSGQVVQTGRIRKRG